MAFKQTYLTIVSQFGGLRLAFPEVPIKREDFAQMTQDVLKQMPKKAKSKRWANNVVQVENTPSQMENMPSQE